MAIKAWAGVGRRWFWRSTASRLFGGWIGFRPIEQGQGEAVEGTVARLAELLVHDLEVWVRTKPLLDDLAERAPIFCFRRGEDLDAREWKHCAELPPDLRPASRPAAPCTPLTADPLCATRHCTGAGRKLRRDPVFRALRGCLPPRVSPQACAPLARTSPASAYPVDTRQRQQAAGV